MSKLSPAMKERLSYFVIWVVLVFVSGALVPALPWWHAALIQLVVGLEGVFIALAFDVVRWGNGSDPDEED